MNWSDSVGKPRAVHPYAWLWQPLESEASLEIRAMFGTKAVYLDGKLVLCFSARQGDWHGVLVATERCHHASLLADFPALAPHPVLPKWLFLPDSSDSFESSAGRLVSLAKKRDPRIGIVPPAKKRSSRRRHKVT